MVLWALAHCNHVIHFACCFLLKVLKVLCIHVFYLHTVKHITNNLNSYLMVSFTKITGFFNILLYLPFPYKCRSIFGDVHHMVKK